MRNNGGRVIFTHAAHSRLENTPCSACHHEIAITRPAAKGLGNAKGAPAGELPPVIPCADCHGSVDNPSFIEKHQAIYAKQGGDKSCVTCHHTRFDGLASGWDHATHAEQYASGDCSTCHHPAEFQYREGKTVRHNPQKCSNCHTAKGNKLTPTTLKAAAHAKCEPCHSDLFEQKAKGCPTCHNSTPTAADLEKGTLDKRFASCAGCHEGMPGNMDAFHKSCMGCHEKAGKGPTAKAPCAQCHTP